MTGAERSALRLALSMLRSRREWRWHEIANVLEAGGAEDHVPGMRRWSTESDGLLFDRQRTVRVALYIRAVLRAEEGTSRYRHCSKRSRGFPCTCWDSSRVARPLWAARAGGGEP